jgi:hypothetical protein
MSPPIPAPVAGHGTRDVLVGPTPPPRRLQAGQRVSFCEENARFSFVENNGMRSALY